jgi:periplasmic divalent cation tolerance protein
MTAVFYTTIDSEANAQKLAEELIQSKLVACVNVIPAMKSFYEWEGKLCKDEELVMILKSDKTKFSAIESFFEENHPYETPCLLEMSVSNVSEAYNSWLSNQLK